jgi:WD40 repeat protein/serine/threonine protein kinase
MAGCAGRERLERFLGGDLGPAASEEIAAHVEGCTACQRILDQLSGEAPGLLHPDRPGESDDPEPAPEFLERLRRTLLGTAPPPDIRRLRSSHPLGQSGAGSSVHRGRDAGAPSPAAVSGYEVIGELSRGGMGVVYRARQIGLNRIVALKMILAGARAGAEDRARFRAEAEAVARLHHPNVVQIHDIGECDGCPYFSMELVDRPTLAAACHGRPQPARSAAAMVETLARAIDCAHRQGIVHRDLKPANILLQPTGARAGRDRDGVGGDGDRIGSTLSSAIWTPKLADFGLAKRLDDMNLTQHGRILGTPSYMAPEQVDGRGRRPGPAVDIYSLGAILYELLTGRPPFLAGSIESTLALVTGEDPIPPRRLRPDVPRDLETIALKCLEKSPSRRYASAAGLAGDLGRYLRGEPILARAPSSLDRWVKFARRHVTEVGGVAAVIVALALGIAGTSVMAVREARARRQANRSADIAKAAARAAETERKTAVREAYQARLAAAMAAMGTHDIREAGRQLEEAPVELRGWEWVYLHGRLDQSLAVVTGLRRADSMALCPPGERIAVADGRGYRILDAATGECRTVRSTASPCHRVYAFQTKAGPRFVLDRSGETQSFSLTDGDGLELARIALLVRRLYREAYLPFVMAMSPDGRRLALQTMPYDAGPLVEVFDTATGLRTSAFGAAGVRLLGLDFSPDGRSIAACHETSEVFIFEVQSGRQAAVLRGHQGLVRGVAFSLDGRLLASCGDDQTIRVWGVAAGRILSVLSGHVGGVTCLAFSPDGRRLVSGGSDGTVRLWGVEGGDALLVLSGHTDQVLRVAFDRDGRAIASIARDGTARLWDATTLDDIRVLRGHTSYVYPVAYSPDGRRIASGSWDHTVRLWDAVGGRPARAGRGHTHAVGALAFTPDGTRLASWSHDGTIRFWDAATGEEIGPALNHEDMPSRDSVYSLVVSPGGRRLGAAMRRRHCPPTRPRGGRRGIRSRARAASGVGRGGPTPSDPTRPGIRPRI